MPTGAIVRILVRRCPLSSVLEAEKKKANLWMEKLLDVMMFTNILSSCAGVNACLTGFTDLDIEMK